MFSERLKIGLQNVEVPFGALFGDPRLGRTEIGHVISHLFQLGRDIGSGRAVDPVGFDKDGAWTDRETAQDIQLRAFTIEFEHVATGNVRGLDDGVGEALAIEIEALTDDGMLEGDMVADPRCA